MNPNNSKYGVEDSHGIEDFKTRDNDYNEKLVSVISSLLRVETKENKSFLETGRPSIVETKKDDTPIFDENVHHHHRKSFRAYLLSTSLVASSSPSN